MFPFYIQLEHWNNYYECLETYKRERLRKISTFRYHEVFEGESAFLKCSLCVPPHKNKIIWLYMQVLFKN